MHRVVQQRRVRIRHLVAVDDDRERLLVSAGVEHRREREAAFAQRLEDAAHRLAPEVVGEVGLRDLVHHEVAAVWLVRDSEVRFGLG